MSDAWRRNPSRRLCFAIASCSLDGSDNGSSRVFQLTEGTNSCGFIHEFNGVRVGTAKIAGTANFRFGRMRGNQLILDDVNLSDLRSLGAHRDP